MPCDNTTFPPLNDTYRITGQAQTSLFHHDTVGDWRYLSLVDSDMGRPAGVLQSGPVRGQRVSAGAPSAADTATALRTVRCGLATRSAMI